MSNAVLSAEESLRQWPAGSTKFYTDDLLGADDLWKDAFEEAISRWNDVATSFRILFTREFGTGYCTSSGTNSARYSSTACGDQWGENTLAATQSYFAGGLLIKTDIIFNDNEDWDVYDGIIQFYANDFRRVAMHELGHAIGLAHLDDVNAIMYETVGDTYLPQLDDVNSLLSIYGSTFHTLTLNNVGSGYISVEPRVLGTGIVDFDSKTMISIQYSKYFDCHAVSCELSIQDGLRLNILAVSDADFLGWTGTEIDSAGVSLSQIISDRTLTANHTPLITLSAPTDLITTGLGSNDYVTLTWTAVSGATSYEVYRCATSSILYCGSSITSTEQTTYNDSGGIPGTPYYYRVTACSGGSCGDFSDASIGAKTIRIPTTPGLAESTVRVLVAWINSYAAETISLYRCTSVNVSSCGSPIYEGTETYFIDIEGSAGTTYYYRLKACFGAECSEFSNYKAGTKSVSVVRPLLPPSPEISPSTDSVSISWASINLVETYEVFRCTTEFISSCGSQLISTSSTNYDDSEGIAGVTYYYRTKACNSAGCSSFSDYSIGAIITLSYASFSDNQLSIPAVAVNTVFGMFYYTVVLELSSTLPFYDFSIVSSIEIENFQSGEHATFTAITNTLNIPRVQVGELMYRIEFQLIQVEELILFRLKNAEEL